MLDNYLNDIGKIRQRNPKKTMTHPKSDNTDENSRDSELYNEDDASEISENVSPTFSTTGSGRLNNDDFKLLNKAQNSSSKTTYDQLDHTVSELLVCAALTKTILFGEWIYL